MTCRLDRRGGQIDDGRGVSGARGRGISGWAAGGIVPGLASQQALQELDLSTCEGDDCNALTNSSAEKCRVCGALLADEDADDEDDDLEEEEAAAPITSIGGVSLQGVDVTKPNIVRQQ